MSRPPIAKCYSEYIESRNKLALVRRADSAPFSLRRAVLVDRDRNRDAAKKLCQEANSGELFATL
jgi:hypothetical protein